MRDVTTVVAMSFHSSAINSSGAVPMTRPTRKSPPMTGVAINSLKRESAVAWMSVTCQFAAATSAPRLRTGLRNRSLATERFMLIEDGQQPNEDPTIQVWILRSGAWLASV